MTRPSPRAVGLLAVCAILLIACSGGPAATPTPAGTSGSTTAPITAAPTAGPGPIASAPTGPSLQTIVGQAPPAVPAGTTWIRVGDDNGAYTFEVPSTWTQHQTVPWQEADGSSSGTIVVAGPVIGGLGTDFSQPGVAIGVSANPGGRTVREVVDADDYAAVCTGGPAEEETGDGYTAAFRYWSPCGGRDGAFLIVVVIQPTGTQALFAVIFQGASEADLGYVEHVMTSLRTGSGAPEPTGGAVTTAPPINSQGWAVNVEECLLQIGDAIAIGTVTNTDTRDHSYRVIVRFTDRDGLLIGENHWDTPGLAPGQAFRYQIRQLAQGYAEVRCTVSEVLIRN